MGRSNTPTHHPSPTQVLCALQARDLPNRFQHGYSLKPQSYCLLGLHLKSDVRLPTERVTLMQHWCRWSAQGNQSKIIIPASEIKEPSQPQKLVEVEHCYHGPQWYSDQQLHPQHQGSRPTSFYCSNATNSIYDFRNCEVRSLWRGQAKQREQIILLLLTPERLAKLYSPLPPSLYLIHIQIGKTDWSNPHSSQIDLIKQGHINDNFVRKPFGLKHVLDRSEVDQ